MVGGAPAEVEVLLVAPEDRGAGPHDRLGEHIVQIDDLVTPLVTDYDEHGAVASLVAVLHERPDAAVDFLPHL